MLIELKRSSCAYAILEYGYFAYAFTTNDAHMSLYAYRSPDAITKGLRQLKEREYIEPVPGVEGYWRLSERGLLYMSRQDDYYRDRKGMAAHTPPAELKKKEIRLSMQAFMCGAGASVYPKDKPSFAGYVKSASPGMAVPEYVCTDDSYFPFTENEIEDALENGIYYSRRELMDGITALGKGTEPFINSTVIGIVFTRTNIYMVYNTKKYAVTWKYNEKRLIDMIEAIFCRSGRYESRVPICIYTGKTYAMAHAFATCYIHGRMRHEKDQDEEEKNRLLMLQEKEVASYMQEVEARRSLRAERAAMVRAAAKSAKTAKENGYKNKFNFFNAENSDFREIYYVPVGRQFTGTLEHILKGDIKTLIAEGDAWFAAHRDKGFEQAAGAHEITCGRHTASAIKVAFLPAAEIKSLYTLRNSTEKTSVVTTPELADCISHILGRNLETVYDTDGNEISVKRYDEYGYQLDGDVYERISQTNRERAAEKVLRDGGRKVQLTARVMECEYDKIKDLADEAGKSISAYTGELISYALVHAVEEKRDGTQK